MWNLAGVPVILTKWSPVIEKEKPPVQSIPMWVHIKNVPIKLFSWQGLSFLTSPIGIPSRLHPETAQCLNLEEAKIFVKVDLTKDLPKKMNFDIGGENVMVEYFYPRLPTKCMKCDKWGHAVKACPLDKETQMEEMKDEDKRVDHMEEKEEGEIEIEKISKMVEDKVEETKQLDGGEDVTMEKGEKTSPRRVGMKCIEEIEKEKEWLKVSPGKSCRSLNMSQRRLEFEQESLPTESRFAVLMLEEEHEVMGLDNKEQEDEEIQEVVQEDEEHEALEDEITHRRMLPRESKINHRYLKDKGSQRAQEVNPSNLNKKKTRRHKYVWFLLEY